MFAHAAVDLLNHQFVQLTTAAAAVAVGAFLLVLPTEFPSRNSPEFKTGVYAISLAVIQVRAQDHFLPLCPCTQILNLHQMKGSFIADLVTGSDDIFTVVCLQITLTGWAVRRLCQENERENWQKVIVSICTPSRITMMMRCVAQSLEQQCLRLCANLRVRALAGAAEAGLRSVDVWHYSLIQPWS